MESVLEILSKCEKYFASKGVPNPKIDAQHLLAKAMGCKRLDLFLKFDHPVMGESLDKFREYAKRRAKREPLQHILGNVDFFGITLKSDSRALIPRPETEELCEIVSEELFPDEKSQIKILDMGTGSGAIALALASRYPNAEVVAIDNSDSALELARENRESLSLSDRVKILKSDWFENVAEKNFDLIAANPPYLSDSDVDSSEPEVGVYDPSSALRSGDDGFADLKKILSQAREFLNVGGAIICECSPEQPKKLSEMFPEYDGIARPDSSGRDRFFIGFSHPR